MELSITITSLQLRKNLAHFGIKKQSHGNFYLQFYHSPYSGGYKRKLSRHKLDDIYQIDQLKLKSSLGEEHLSGDDNRLKISFELEFEKKNSLTKYKKIAVGKEIPIPGTITDMQSQGFGNKEFSYLMYSLHSNKKTNTQNIISEIIFMINIVDGDLEYLKTQQKEKKKVGFKRIFSTCKTLEDIQKTSGKNLKIANEWMERFIDLNMIDVMNVTSSRHNLLGENMVTTTFFETIIWYKLKAFEKEMENQKEKEYSPKPSLQREEDFFNFM